jgi:hypothetical protein
MSGVIGAPIQERMNSRWKGTKSALRGLTGRVPAGTRAIVGT